MAILIALELIIKFQVDCNKIPHEEIAFKIGLTTLLYIIIMIVSVKALITNR